MRHPLFFAVALVGFLGSVPMAHAIYPNPVTPATMEPVITTAEEFLAAAKKVEANPVGPDADALRKPMAEWIEKTPDVSVDLCDDLAPIAKPSPLEAILFFQYMMESAVYQLRHPHASGKDAQVAGYQAVVDLYASLQKRFPQSPVSHPYADALTADAREGRKGLEKHTCEKPTHQAVEPASSDQTPSASRSPTP